MDKNIQNASTIMMILNLIAEEDMYGYQMIHTLALRSDDTFQMKAGTLYPILHGMEEKGLITSYEKNASPKRVRKYYRITEEGRAALAERKREWQIFSEAVNRVIKGGMTSAANG